MALRWEEGRESVSPLLLKLPFVFAGMVPPPLRYALGAKVRFPHGGTHPGPFVVAGPMPGLLSSCTRSARQEERSQKASSVLKPVC
jgi:hypothetical protein